MLEYFLSIADTRFFVALCRKSYDAIPVEQNPERIASKHQNINPKIEFQLFVNVGSEQLEMR